MMNMGLPSSLFSLILLLLTVSIVKAAIGPVYVDPNAPKDVPLVKPTAVQAQVDLITQTVYGFLDFTTTIGNTVMVFSPQSAAAVVTEPPKTEKPEPPPIETRPTTETSPSTSATIKPSKTVVPKKETSEKKPAVVVSSVVQVVEEKQPIVKAKPAKAAKHASSKVEILEEKKQTVLAKKEIITKVEVREDQPSVVNPVIASTQAKTSIVQPTVSVVTHVEEAKPVVISSVVEVHSSSDNDEDDDNENDDDDVQPVLAIENNIGEPEYDFLSRQSEYAEESFKVRDNVPTQPRRKQPTAKRVSAQQQNNHPTGLVTKLGGTVVNDGVTTVHETSVIGTSINGKYAQVLQSTSHILVNNAKVKPTPSSSLRILKTAAPTLSKTPKYSDDGSDDPVEAYGNNGSPNLVRASRRPAQASGSFKNRYKNNNAKEEVEVVQPSSPNTPAYGNGNKKNRPRNGLNKGKNFKSNVRVEVATVSAETAATHAPYSSRRNKATRQGNFKPTSTYSSQQSATESHSSSGGRRTFKKPHPSPVDQDSHSTSLYKFKLNRAPGRWQYKTTAKPRVTIRKQNELVRDEAPETRETPENKEPVYEVVSRSDEGDLEQQGSLINGDVLGEGGDDNRIDRKFPIETINVEISTPADFKETYFEIATIKSPYTFQVGTLKNTRYITVTSTFEKTLEPEPTISATLTEPLTENILAKTSHIDKEHNLLDSSIATLPAITLGADTETPPLETLTETFSTTQLMLKTHILPVIRGENTTSHTLIQTYHVTRLVTATKTLPPMEVYQFVPSKRLNEFNSRLDEAGSELHLELEYGESDDDDDEDAAAVRKEFPSDLDLSNVGSDFDLSEVDKTNIPDNVRPKKKITSNNQNNRVTTEAPLSTPNLTQEQLQQLALLRLLNPAAAAQIPNVITTSKPVIKIETVYDTHVLPIVNGANTIFSTLSRPIGTVTKTDYEMVTSSLPALPIPPIPQVNPALFPQQAQQQFQLQSTPIITQLMLTQTNSKVLKLTFGAKTAYTTLFSTTVVPTQLTTYLTQSVAVQPTAAFPGYFPAPYAPFPYVG